MNVLARRFAFAAALVLPSIQAAAGAAPGVLSFIIPTNTCEQSPPLQVLPAGRQ